MPVVIFGAVALFAVVALLTKKQTAAAAIPLVTLPSTGSTSNAGETALQQESQAGITTATSVATSLATGNVAGAASAAISGLLTQLTQHSQRLSDAKSENAAIPAAVQAFDADMASIAAAYSSGKASAVQVMQAVLALDNNVYNYLHGLVGKPGTAWPATQPAPTSSAPPPGVGITCNTKCTASCCLFYNDLNPAIVTVFNSLQGQPGGPWYTAEANGFILKVPEVYPPDDSAYGTFSRPSYTLVFTAPSSTPASLLASVI
jgi:hypothetical protein